MTIKLIAASLAFQMFSKLGVTVVDFKRDDEGAVLVKKVKRDDGVERPVSTSEERALTEADILKAVDYGDGRGPAIVTIDGKRYFASELKAAKAADSDDAAAKKAAADKAAADKEAADKEAADKEAADKEAADKAAADKAAADKRAGK